jgi:hypothetical protein
VHFALTIAEQDYEAMVAQIGAHGEHVEENYFGDDPKAPGMRSAYIEDPDGNIVEIWSRNLVTKPGHPNARRRTPASRRHPPTR